MKVLIGYDGSPSADRALDGLERAGLPQRTEALVLSVADVFLPPSHAVPETPVASAFSEVIRKARERAREALREAQAHAVQAGKLVGARFPDWKVSVSACADSPAWAIIKKADEWKADLVVTGAQGHSALGRLFLGSVSQKVLAEAPCSVRIGRGPAREVDPLRLLLGIDTSPYAHAAVHEVATRLWPDHTEVRVAVAVDLKLITTIGLMDPALMPYTDGVSLDDQSWIRRMAEASAERLRTAGLSASTMVREGDPRRVLLEEADSWGADCIFIGVRGSRTRERSLLGAVSAAVAARAACSVEIVRRAQ
jgi:nucleotide-binding universal stress UspA family protein